MRDEQMLGGRQGPCADWSCGCLLVAPEMFRCIFAEVEDNDEEKGGDDDNSQKKEQWKLSLSVFESGRSGEP